ncbi:CobD/CbiB family protein [Pseudacidovorax intermedius]|uniref:Cobalamin biosynthesis protein CobD n=1 Tax=Pseudacidovorax intermedius TaxID=433924 RepID=A0A370FJ92_9BURK|nr:CobD/CbiB family protein [Pseudacidovorax intermedius]RDI25869.1 adenosylcobinamide-phosphate synthase [Pseudacidovorax intermedius]
MSFFAILCALLIEQVRPLASDNPAARAALAWTRWTSRNFDAGKPHHGWVAWSLAVGVPSLLALGLHWLLMLTLGAPFALVWGVGVLYVTLGFRQFSHHFTEIRDALDVGDEALARSLLARWQRVDAAELPRSEIVRHVIEYSVIAAHRHVLGVLAWFSLGALLGLGPAGAVFYRMSEFVGRYWAYKHNAMSQPASVWVQQAADRAWTVIDWLPARITALGFAVVGSFEEAIDCWRNDARHFSGVNDGVILAATSGALNVRLGGEQLRPSRPLADALVDAADQPGPAISAGGGTAGREPEPAHLRSVVGLVWRSVVLWMLLLALLTLARLLG